MGRAFDFANNIIQHALDVVFPLECIGCGVEGCHACARCLAGVRRADLRFAGRATGSCREALAAYAYADPLVRTLLGDWKYRGWTVAADGVRCLVRRWSAAHQGWLRDATLLPVPLHPRRLRQRGFNQAEAIAGWIGGSSALPMRTDLLWRVRTTSPQARQDVSKRFSNVQGAFAARLPEALKGQKIVLVDDVWTTGATMRACAATLHAAGAKDVSGFAVAWGSPGLDETSEMC